MIIIDSEYIAQRGDEWMNIRAGRATASRFASIITPGGARSSAWTSYADEILANDIHPDQTPWTGNHDTERGNELEDTARDAFRLWLSENRSPKWHVREAGFIAYGSREQFENGDKTPGCSPDGLIYEAVGEAEKVEDGKFLTGTPIAGVEIKCPRPASHIATIRTGEPPSKYLPQIHGSMAVSGLQSWYFVSYAPGYEPFVTEVHWDDFTTKLAGYLAEFFVFYKRHNLELADKVRESDKYAGLYKSSSEASFEAQMQGGLI